MNTKLASWVGVGLAGMALAGCGDPGWDQPIFSQDTPGVGVGYGAAPVVGYGAGSALVPPTVPGYRMTILPSGEPVTCMTSGGSTFSTATCW